jgi:hypothetical protein
LVDNRAIASPDTTVIATGTFCSGSDRFWAVTMISAGADAASAAGAGVSAASAGDATSATRGSAASTQYVDLMSFLPVGTARVTPVPVVMLGYPLVVRALL